MREIRTSGSMSGDGRRSARFGATALILDSTDEFASVSEACNFECLTVQRDGGQVFCIADLVCKAVAGVCGQRSPLGEIRLTLGAGGCCR
jgi:hypothetical protein